MRRRCRPPLDEVLTAAGWRLVQAVCRGLTQRAIAGRQRVGVDRVMPVVRHVLSAMLAVLFMCPRPAPAAEGDAFAAIRSNDLPALRALVVADPQVLARRSPQGITPLLYAAYNERPELVAYLRGQQTALDFFEACVVGDVAAVKRFLARGGDVDARSPDGFTPLGLSVFFRQPAVARVLMEAGAKLDAKASNTLLVAPIHAAVARLDLATLQLLLESGADPDLTQQRLMRPLHEASAAGNLPAVAMLLLFGADPQARNEEGKTPADFAREAGHPALAARLAGSAAKPAAP